jgi:hypothetical protein
MSTNRNARRFITLSATVALIACAPGLAGVASANDSPPPTPTSTTQTTVSPDLLKAVQAARDAYKTTTHTAKDAYRVAKKAMHTAIEASLATQHAALKAAHDALRIAHEAGTDTPEMRTSYEALKSAYETAKHAATTTWLATNTDPKIAFNTAIKSAQDAYLVAVKAAFATYAPTMTIPAGLLHAPGKGHGNAFGHLNVKPAKGTMHVIVKPAKAFGTNDMGMHSAANSHRIA